MTTAAVNLSAQVRQLKHTVYSVAGPSLVGLCLLAIACNAVVLLTTRYISRGRLSATLRLTFSLAASDIWTSIVVATTVVYNAYMPTVLGRYNNSCVALTIEAFRTGGLLTGTFHLMAMSVNHYVSIAHPFVYPRLLNERNTWLVIVLMWLAPPSAFLAVASLVPGQGYRSPANASCGVVDFYHEAPFRLTVSLLILSLLVCMSALYVHVLLILRRMRRKLEHNRQNRAQLGRERRMLVTSLLICGAFFVGWAPTCAHFFLTCATCPLNALRPNPSYEYYSALIMFSCVQLALIMLKSIVNPVIYAVRIPEIKEQLTRHCPCLRASADQSHATLAAKNNNTLSKRPVETAPFLDDEAQTPC